MLKILGLGAALIIIIATVSVGTFAYFNDVAAVTSNSIAAGTLILNVDNTTSHGQVSLSGLKPGDAGTAAIWNVDNGGTIDGTLTMAIASLAEIEGTPGYLNDPTPAVGTMANKVGDTTTTGELGSWVKIAVWLDANHDGNLDVGEQYFTSDGATHTWSGAANTVFNITNVSAAYELLSAWGTGHAIGSGILVPAGTTAGNLMVEYNFTEDHAQFSSVPGYGTLYLQNNAQGDSATFDANFTLTQDIVAPVLSTATVPSGQATKIVLAYNEAIKTTSVPAVTDFTIGGIDAGGRTVTNVAISGSTVTLTMSSDISAGNTITISYTAGTNPIKDISGNNAANLVGRAVTNSLP